jgi:large repetitive protein
MPQTPKAPLFEPLEPKLLLAAHPLLLPPPTNTVVMTLVGGTLNFKGDAADNSLTITQDGSDFIIFPESGTTVTWQGSSYTSEFTGPSMDDVTGLKLDMGAGDDTVTIETTDGANQVLLSRDVTAKMGSGFDVLHMYAVSARNVTADMGASDDYNNSFEFESTGDGGAVLTGNLSITGSKGDDWIDLKGALIAGNVKMNLGNGDNDVDFDTISGNGSYNYQLGIQGNLTINTGGGDDEVEFRDNSDADVGVGGNLTFNLGGGDENHVIFHKSAGVGVGNNLTINSSAASGQTRIYMSNVDIGGNLSVNTGAGSDSIKLWGLWVGGRATVNTGAGYDELSLNSEHPDDGDYARFERGLTVTMGSEDDNMEVDHTWFGGKVRLNGNSGANTLTLVNPDNIEGFEANATTVKNFVIVV